MTLRAVLLGLLCVVAEAVVIPYNEAVVRGTSLTGNHLPACAMILLLALVLVVNPLWRKLRPGREFSGAELALIWILSAIAANPPFRGFAGFLIPLLASVHYYATDANHWAELLTPYLKPGAIVTPRAAELFYEGNWGAPIDWQPWLRPGLYWSVFAMALYAATLGLSVLFRKQWSEHERFAYPLLQAPLELVAPPRPGRLVNDLLADRRLWWGVALSIALHTVNGLHAHYPVVPEIPTHFPVHRAFDTRPWITLRWWPALNLDIYLAVIGIAYLIPLEISFSIWFFFLVFKLEYVIFDLLGRPMNPWIAASRQSFGGILVIAGYMFWTARHHLRDVARRIVRPQPDGDEALSYRAAALATLGGLGGCGLLACAAGAEWWVTLGVLSLWVATTFCLTWMVINGGMYLVQAPYFPTEMLVMAFGSERVGLHSLTVLRIPERALMRDWGEILMPHILQGFRLAGETGLPRRQLAAPILGGLVLCLAVAVPMTIRIGHNESGIATLWGTPNFTIASYQPLANLAQRPVEPSLPELRQTLGGALFTALLLALRARTAAWALHPIGFAVGASYANFHLWSSMMFGWAIKLALMKGGGLRLFRQARPCFIGLIVGDYLASGFWISIGLLTGTPYRILPVP